MDNVAKHIKVLQTIFISLLVLSFICCLACVVLFCTHFDNIAFAEEEPTRYYDSSTGYVSDNLVPNNYIKRWDYNVQSSSSNTRTLVWSQNGWKCYIMGSGSIVGNRLNCTSGWVYLYFVPDNVSSFTLTYHMVAFGFTARANHSALYYGFILNGVERGSTSVNGTICSYGYNFASGLAGQSSLTSVELQFRFSGTNAYYDLDFVSFTNDSSFTGYVPPTYTYGGYDEGFADGVASVPSGYEGISSNGVVKDNLMDNNYCHEWTYNLTASERLERSTRAISNVYGTNSADEWVCSLNNASLSNNVLTFEPVSRQSWISWTRRYPAGFSVGDYTFTVGYSELTSDNVYIVFEFTNTNTRDEPLSLYFNLLESSSFGSISTNITNTYDTVTIYIDGGDASSESITLEWIKFENNVAFSGYVPKSYTMYGYSDGYNDGYNEGYNLGIQENNFIVSGYQLMGGVQSSINFDFPEAGSGGGVVVNYRTDYFTYNGNKYGNYNWGATINVNDTVATFNCPSYEDQYPTFLLASNLGVGQYVFTYNVSEESNWSLILYDKTSSVVYSIVNIIPNVIIGGLNCFAFELNGVFDVYLSMCNQSIYKGETITLTFENSAINPFCTTNIYRNYGQDGSFSAGYNSGYNAGVSAGHIEGYAEGYNVGANDAGSYTFTSLLGSVFDAPITAARGLLDFDILGTNIYGFVLALISIGLVLFLLRVFLRGL